MTKRKIAILGTATTWKDAPFNKPDWEIWVCNRAGLSQKPWHRIFEIHRNWDYESPTARDQFLADLKAVKPPQQVLSIVPLGGKANLVLDRKALFDKYGAIWFSSSFGYMAAHALEQKPTDIGFWGVDLESREEYAAQFAGVRHFIDLAKALGIRIHIPDASSLNRDPSPYADRFETALAHMLEQKAERIKGMISWGEVEVARTRARMHRHEGELNAMRKVAVSEINKDEIQDVELDRQRALRELEGDLLYLGKALGQMEFLRLCQRLFVWNTVLVDGDTGAPGT